MPTKAAVSNVAVAAPAVARQAGEDSLVVQSCTCQVQALLDFGGNPSVVSQAWPFATRVFFTASARGGLQHALHTRSDARAAAGGIEPAAASHTLLACPAASATIS